MTLVWPRPQRTRLIVNRQHSPVWNGTSHAHSIHARQLKEDSAYNNDFAVSGY